MSANNLFIYAYEYTLICHFGNTQFTLDTSFLTAIGGYNSSGTYDVPDDYTNVLDTDKMTSNPISVSIYDDFIDYVKVEKQ